MARSRSLRDRGAINFVKILLFAGVVALGYFGWIFVPLWMDQHVDVSKVVRTACNAAYAGRQVAAVHESLMRGIKDLNLKNEHLNDDGTVTTTPLEFTDDNIDTLEIEKDPLQVTLEIHYTRTVVWPFVKTEHSYDYTAAHTESLEAIKW